MILFLAIRLSLASCRALSLRRIRPAGTASGLLLAVTFGCGPTVEVVDSSVTGGTQAGSGVPSTSGATGGAAGPESCGQWVFSDDQCNACLYASCCAELAACGPGTPCGDLLACNSLCPFDDLPCWNECHLEFGQGEDPGWSASKCLADHCDDACAHVPVDGICDSGLWTGSAMCNDCLSNHCCDEFTAAISPPDVDCLFQDPPCSPKAEAAVACATAACGALCPIFGAQ